MHLIQLLLPLRDDEERPFGHAEFDRVRAELVGRHGGLTAYVRSAAQGAWKAPEGGIDRDEVVIFEVMVEKLDRAWWDAYRSVLERRFRQRELVIRALPIERL